MWILIHLLAPGRYRSANPRIRFLQMGVWLVLSRNNSFVDIRRPASYLEAVQQPVWMQRRIAATLTWLQPHYSSAAPSTSDIPSPLQLSIPSLAVDNSRATAADDNTDTNTNTNTNTDFGTGPRCSYHNTSFPTTRVFMSMEQPTIFLTRILYQASWQLLEVATHNSNTPAAHGLLRGCRTWTIISLPFILC